jgi:3-phenylpropionate/cinnamic acid dioxygenase small subunit
VIVGDISIEQLADEVAITKLVGRIAQLADSGSLTDYAECFTEDAEWMLPAGSGVNLGAQTRSGIDDIVRGAQERRDAGIQGPGTLTRHVVSTVVVDVAGDRATGRAYYCYYGKTDQTPQLLTMGQYDDEFVRTPDGWRLHRRQITRG